MSTYRTGFWNRIAKSYASRPVGDEAAYQVKLDKTAALMTPDMRVLEFGCGTGTTALKHAGRVAQIDAIDFSEEMIAIARDKGTGIENVHFAVSPIEEWPVPDGGYDMVMAHSVLHLVNDVDATLMQVRKMLKPGGFLVTSTTCIGDMNPLLTWFIPLSGAVRVIPRVHRLKADRLRERIRAAGFEEVEFWRPAPGKAVFIIARAI